MLVQNRFFREAEYLLSRKESQGILLDCDKILSNLIEGYLGDFELDKGLSIYEGMRKLDLVPSFSSYKAILEYLVQLNETELMYNVYVDMIKTRMGKNAEEKEIHENVIQLLCRDGKVQEARYLVKKITGFGIKPTNLAVNAISSGYCYKKDYNDLLGFFTEAHIVPNAKLGNKILFSLCRNFGSEQANVFLQKLEEINFCPDEITFGILIGFSCREGKLKNSFFYISEIVSRGLKPDVYSYNALLSRMFKEDMWVHARDVLVEMNDTGVIPNLSTYKVLLAGFCKARKFDEVKAIVSEMADRNLIKLSKSDDILTEGFKILGLSPSAVKIKRDNDKGLPKAEFFDNLGNGLYLDTDMDAYEKKTTRVLEDCMVLDFNSVIIEKNRSLDIKIIVDEMENWGQELSLPALSSLLRAPFSVETVNRYLAVMFESIYKLDHEDLNILIRVFSKKGFTFRARTVFDGIVRRGYTVENDTYSALLFDTCKKGDLRSFRYICELARKFNWSPGEKDRNALLGFLCKNRWFNETFELFEIFLSVNSNDIIDTFHVFLEKLCSQGFTSMARVFLDECSNQADIFDRTAYTRLVNGFCREKKFTEALKVFETMLSRNLSPSVDVYTQMISHLCKTNSEKAVELKNSCLREQPSALIPINRALIKGFSKSGRIENAASLFKEVLSLKGLILDAEVCNALIEGYCGQKNNFKKVKELLGAMIRKNLSISVSNYSKMLCLSCTDGKLSLAMSLKELMLQVSDLSPLVLHNILIFHVSSMCNHFLLDKIISKGLHFDDVTYNYVIRGFLLCDDTSRSLYYLTNMMSQDFQPSNRTLRKLIARFCENGDINPALDLCREMESRNWIFGSFIQNKIVDALLGNGNIREAVDFLDKLASKDLIFNNVSYDYLIKRFYQHGRLDKSVDLLNLMLRKGFNPESVSYDYIIRGFCDGYKWDKALDFYTEMLCRGLKPGLITCEILVCGLSECGRLGEGERILRSMIEFGENPRREVFETLVNKYTLEKNTSKVSEVVRFMQQNGYEPDFETHWSLISNLSDSSRKDESVKNSGFLSGLLSGFGIARKKN
ncbi:pentatricopeptide repeat-containing protein at5g15280 [Phtheirospermum japonicum]|uniref:Pentatricopeptide repeat-containing protein at5g15280 n=1 Tax=Phtheirospermum japonicum TaxID=374723 RepID=A0A830BUB0_9LAMI|nr:pentatricopeptide repeat-containing protein at5g15280 [Phtheirospermum japonicum]